MGEGELTVEKEAVEDMITAGGYHYIESEQGVKVRNSLVGRRLKEDGETFEEYKMRQKFVKNFNKETAKGKWFWKSRKKPELDLQLKMAVGTPGILESKEFSDHKSSNLGTYDEKKVESYLKSL
tara:strand:+ start:1360 stop:1731 length:372 start_codon:yes stop_codon:yes gene_type:complete